MYISVTKVWKITELAFVFLTNRGFIHGPEGGLLYSDCRGIILHASGISGLSGGHL